MSTDFSLPLAHVETSAANAPTLQACLGRPFRQPAALDNSNEYSDGLEIWLPETGDDGNVFAMLEGQLQFFEPNNGTPAYLELEVSIDSQNEQNDIPGLLEPPLVKIIYENIDEVETEIAIRGLLATAYTDATTTANRNDWHPSMRQIFQGQRMKAWLDSAAAGNERDGRLDNLADAFMIAANGMRLSVLAGNQIAVAGVAPDDLDVPTDDCNLTGNDLRLVRIVTEEYVGNRLNPSFYIWRLLKNSQHTNQNSRYINVVTRAPVQQDNTFDHPFLTMLEIDLNSLDDSQQPRVLSAAQMPGQGPNDTLDVLLFPIPPKLRNWHSATFGNNQSTLEWRYTSDANLDFETRFRDNPGANRDTINGDTFYTCDELAPPAGADSICPDPQGNDGTELEDIWNDWGDDINEICCELQVPAEIIAATIRKESNGVERALALEGLRADEINALNNAGVSATIITQAQALMPEYGLTVPDPWNGAGVINAAESNLTWNQLLDVVDVVPHRQSPGLMQTLGSTARRRVLWLTRFYDDVPIIFNVNPLPNNDRDWFTWLLTGRHAILAGVAHIKFCFCYGDTMFDVPHVAGAYNAGSVREQGQHTDRHNRHNPWRLRANRGYIHLYSRYYNAIQDHFTTDTLGQARFWEGL